MAFDPSNDYLTFDGLEAVDLYQRTGDSTFADAVSVPHALRLAANREFLEQAGLLGKEGITWDVWSNDLPDGTAPRKQDVIQDAAGERWRVARVNYRGLIRRYRCDCVREV